MKEFLCFAHLGVVVYADYRREGNTLFYFSNRPMSIDERLVIDQYMLYTFAPDKTAFYETVPATFSYGGVDQGIVNAMDTVQEMQAAARSNEGDVAAAVKDVITGAMRSYYFDRIGEALRDGDKGNIAALVEAYNAHAEKKISVEALLKK